MTVYATVYDQPGSDHNIVVAASGELLSAQGNLQAARDFVQRDVYRVEAKLCQALTKSKVCLADDVCMPHCLDEGYARDRPSRLG